MSSLCEPTVPAVPARLAGLQGPYGPTGTAPLTGPSGLPDLADGGLLFETHDLYVLHDLPSTGVKFPNQESFFLNNCRSSKIQSFWSTSGFH